MTDKEKNGIFLGLGSNIGNRQACLSDCIGRLSTVDNLKIVESSSIYETEAVGYKNQDLFLNIVLEIEYSGSPSTLLTTVLHIETTMGRKDRFRWGPRIIDIDILYFNNRIIDTETLKIPHPEVTKRNFVLKPLAEIAPDYCCPLSGNTVQELLENNCDTNAVVMYPLVALKQLF
jgi:2-amino-4-hydroxy-6-hydroxymethyldihydropteridine diphosphokinase